MWWNDCMDGDVELCGMVVAGCKILEWVWFFGNLCTFTWVTLYASEWHLAPLNSLSYFSHLDLLSTMIGTAYQAGPWDTWCRQLCGNELMMCGWSLGQNKSDGSNRMNEVRMFYCGTCANIEWVISQCEVLSEQSTCSRLGDNATVRIGGFVKHPFMFFITHHTNRLAHLVFAARLWNPDPHPYPCSFNRDCSFVNP